MTGLNPHTIFKSTNGRQRNVIFMIITTSKIKHLHENAEHDCVTSDNIEYNFTDSVLDSMYVLKS